MLLPDIFLLWAPAAYDLSLIYTVGYELFQNDEFGQIAILELLCSENSSGPKLEFTFGRFKASDMHFTSIAKFAFGFHFTDEHRGRSGTYKY
jgi:hypothetical protein